MRILSLNIQNRNNIDRIIPFLRQHTFDIVMFQEVFQDYIELFENALQMRSVFAPQVTKDGVPWGVAAFTAEESAQTIVRYYSGSMEQVKPFRDEARHDQCKALVGFTVVHEESEYRFLSTHFTWSPEGTPDDHQRQDVQLMLDVLGTYDHFVLCGDFNAPRGTEIFDLLAYRYKDNIPPEIVRTLDPVLHRAPEFDYVVDGVFSTPEYLVQNVQVINGVSDHCAILAEIYRSR